MERVVPRDSCTLPLSRHSRRPLATFGSDGSEAPSAEHARLTAMAEVPALVCQRKCVVEGCSYFCAENPFLVVAGVTHAHHCAVHRDMSVEARAARLENAI